MALAPQTRLGPYEILAPLGAGGMGEVYKATDTRLGRTVAIKTLNREHLARFEREARAIAALNHPHICTLFDLGPDYLVMEYIEGAPLRGPLPPAEAVRLSLQILAALDTAHGKGIIHRDLKPGNILLTSAGVKLLDFGLAKVAQAAELSDSTVTETHAGTVMGTAAYMSPEQAEGKPVDERADIFSFGAVLYEMLSGRRAFTGDSNLSTMTAVLRDEPAPLDGSTEMAQVVKKCLRKQPAQRYQSAAEVRQALEAAASAAPTEKNVSIAVLPFTNMSGDKENEYFSDGLAEEIINALTKIPGLKVAARTSAFAFKGKNDDIRKIGETLGMAHILEGSVRKAGSRVRITAQLIAVADGCHLWSDRYDREMTDIFAVQDEISQAIVEVLKVKLAPAAQSAPRRPTTNVAAYQAYLEGRYNFQLLAHESVIRAGEYFERAIQLDPGFAAPYAGLAEAQLYSTHYSPAPVNEVIPKALAAAARSIELDPNAPEGYIARGFIRGASEYRWKAGCEDFDRALQLSPESPLAHYRKGIWYLMPVGRTQEAVEETRRAAELDPLSMLCRSVEALALNHDGQNQRAVDCCRSVLKLFPKSFVIGFIAGITLGGSGEWGEAQAALDLGFAAAPGNAWLSAVQAAVYSGLGKTAEVARTRASFDDLASRQYVPAAVLGVIHAAEGDLDGAFERLDRAVDERQVWTIQLIRAPLFARLLPASRLDALLRKMNLL